MSQAGEAARAAGETIDSSLLQTASGADSLELADARVAATSERVAAAAREQAAAERELLDAQAAAAAGGDAAAGSADRLLAADRRLTAAQKETAVAGKAQADAQRAQADTAAAMAAGEDDAAVAVKRAGDAADTSRGRLSGVTKAAGLVALGMAAAGYESVKAAGNFQDATTHLVTDAGESAKNLAMVQAGILQVSTATGISATDITNAMYHIESGGYHGAAGLKMLQIAAEGARVGGADLDTVSKTLVGTMNAYGMSAGRSAAFMNQLIATVGAGDMRMQDLASSLSSVAPLAAAVRIKFSQVGGAIATMTAQGMSADQATQDLANTIRALSNPNNVAITEMNQLGVNAQEVSKNLGSRGLAGTIGYLTRAITSRMGKSGQVIMSAFTQSTTAGKDLQVMLGTMPPQFRKLAQGFMDGSVSAKDWRKILLAQTPVNQTLMTQFASLYEKSHSFNSLLASGGPAAQTYTAALAKMMGGATGLNTALMLSGSRMATFQANTATIQAAADKGGTSVDNWARIQGTFNYKLQSAKVAVENTGIAVGTALLPAVTKILQVITRIAEPIAEWTAHHRTLTTVIIGTVGAIATAVVMIGAMHKAYTAVTGTITTVKSGLQAVGLIAKDSAAAQETAAADSAAAQETAATESSGAWLQAAASTVAGWVAAGVRMAATAAIWVGQTIVKTAIVVGANIAGAATSAAAWIAANALMIGGIGLVIAAVAVAVYEIVTHWHDIVAGVEDAWREVYRFTSQIISDAVSFVRDHWRLIISIIGGPLGITIALVTKYWSDIARFFKNGVHAVSVVLSWFAGLPGMFASWIAGAATAVWNAGVRLLGWFASLPGKAWNALSSMYNDMLSVGENIVIGIWNGIVHLAGWLWHQVTGWAGGLVHSIASAFGIGSPSKYTHEHGRMLAQGVADGITARTSAAVAAARQMAARVLGATAGMSAGGYQAGSLSGYGTALAGGAGGGGTVMYNHFDFTGAHIMSDRDIDLIMSKLERKLTTIVLPAAGRTTRAF